MNLQPRKETIIVQDEVLLNTQGLVHKVGGITLDGSSFGDGVVKAGTAVMEGPSGFYVPYADDTGAFPAGAKVFLTAQDAVVKDEANAIVGAFVKAYVNEAKLTGVTQAFKDATGSRYIWG